ncbi:hypothetical protein HPT25_03660 [Bacillus sp. BRMEA1]|uniref:hypothetical protein n=1 Tax=Neobacillus endophyticus TaxID=2738405 RepID=UPI0015679D9A|nr:hypothetical protein [Neobacillus endophyticus]NRD76587.1 hypothetical protein [Neobacillus endophyticus]
MENVAFIEMVFENCESIVIPINRVKRMEFGTLTPFEHYPYKGLSAFRSEYGLLDLIYQNESELHYNDSDYEEFLEPFIGNKLSNHVEERPNILGRILNYNDIVMIQFLDQNQQHIKNIYVPWHEDDREENRYMLKEANNGILNIEIRVR